VPTTTSSSFRGATSAAHWQGGPQLPDEQSLSLPQGFPGEQFGAHAGCAHTPAVQTCDPQSPLAPQ
jgi:hypothetical protein